MLSFLNKLFGSKSERDIKAIQPLVVKTNQEYALLQSLSDDELRNETQNLKSEIQDYLSEIDTKINDINTTIESQTDLDMDVKMSYYEQLDTLEQERNVALEEILNEILPRAFAVIKETSRRLTENQKLVVTATEYDYHLASIKKNVQIEGSNAIHHNKWDAAGVEVTWQMVHYDVQIIGGIALHQGKIAEMGTGEGKTLVATLPAYLNALAARGVHMVTVNDYLARRDSEWMGPLYEFHGLKIDCIDKHQPNSEARRQAYLADITFGTNNEFGFDYLRDNMVQSPEELVQRKLHYAMVDEVDSVLIDDARTPLIISGPIPHGDRHEFFDLKPRIEKLVLAQKTYVNNILNDAKKLIQEGKSGPEEGGLALLRAHRALPKNKVLIKFLSEPGMQQILHKTENHYMQDQNKEMPKVDAELFFVIDEKHNSVDLTEKGTEFITSSGEDSKFFILPDVGAMLAKIEHAQFSNEEKASQKESLMNDFAIKSERIHSVNQLLKAYTLFEKDIEYILDSGKVKIVDEQTGRVMEGRRYSDGLHQAIEAKENVRIEDATQTYATVTLQNYFRMYHKLSGMTGTAVTEAGELWEIYKLDVVEIPTNRAIQRKDHEDFVYRTMREKYNAVVEEIVTLTEAKRPVLVGTTSVEISELLSRMLKMRGIKHNVLNAKMHQREAEIVAEAGVAGTVTIATNMAGRGTDIKLGIGVKEAGGLAIIGTERHESRRVDRQLRGRAGRQGDPGSSQFFVSLEDQLMRLFGSERISNLMLKMGIEDGEVIQHSMITKSIERAQKKVEENNFGIRKRLLEYDDVMNAQRNVIYAKRHHALLGERLDVDLSNMIFDSLEDIVSEYKSEKNYDGFAVDMLRIFAISPNISQEDFDQTDTATLLQSLYQEVMQKYIRKSENMAKQTFPIFENIIKTQVGRIENVVVPFSDGIKEYQIPIPLRKTIDTQGKEFTKTVEKNIVLNTIDDAWKEHLLQMDDLKQSVQNAVYEQKDPLLVYKFEAFQLFKQLLSDINKEVVSFLFKANLPSNEEADIHTEAKTQKTNMTSLKVSKPDFYSGANVGEEEKQKAQPIRVEQKIGRNDPCPCGSGKKYKTCHGAGMV